MSVIDSVFIWKICCYKFVRHCEQAYSLAHISVKLYIRLKVKYSIFFPKKAAYILQ